MFACATQIWPEEIFPLRTVGRLVLDQNIDNFHNESEQIAFSPGLSPPGPAAPPCLRTLQHAAFHAVAGVCAADAA
jgi:catalase